MCRLMVLMVVSLFFFGFVSGLEAQHGNKGPAQHPNAGKMQEKIKQRMEILKQIYHLDEQIGKIHKDFVPQFVKLREEYHHKMQHFNQNNPLAPLLAERHRLHEEEADALNGTIDPAKIKEIHTRYARLIADLEKQFGPRQKEILLLQHEMQEKINPIMQRWESEIRQINPLENSLESQLLKLINEEKQAIHKLLDQNNAEHKDLINRYEGKIKELQAKLDELQKVTNDANQQRIQKEATVEQNLQQQLQTLKKEEDREIARQDAKIQMKTIEQEYRDTITAFNPPENRIEIQIARIREEEARELQALVDPMKLKAIKKEYQDKIAVLERKIRNQENQKSRFIEERNKEIRMIESGYRSKIATLNPSLWQF